MPLTHKETNSNKENKTMKKIKTQYNTIQKNPFEKDI